MVANFAKISYVFFDSFRDAHTKTHRHLGLRIDFTNELLPDEFAPVKIVIGFKLNVEPLVSKTLKFLMQ